jgi:hypothetical protein
MQVKKYYLSYDFVNEPSPFIATDPITGRHFIYDNNDQILVFSHNPIYDYENDKSKPLIEIPLGDKDEYK